MTNAEIIYRARVQLAKDGKLAIEDNEIEEIHTYNKWKELGYQVQRGQKAICQLAIWKAVNGKKEDEESDVPAKTKMMIKTAFFFSRTQVADVEA